jgi:uncharacterized C2H2 Zn-finger protein
MFFFIGGLQPKTIDLDKKPVMCPSCGLYQAKLKRVDHYLSIFFIPVLRVKKGEPFLLCERCGAGSKKSNDDLSHFNIENQKNRCPHCGALIEKVFSFCPFCGGKV